MIYSAIGVAVSSALFFSVHAFARPPPRTMTKEWQEATNEYLRVSVSRVNDEFFLTITRLKDPILFMVSAAKDILERVTYRASRRSHKASK